MPVLSSNIEEVFHQINNFTTLKSCHNKQKTTHSFEEIRNYILDKMCEEDPVFAYLTNGHCLAGSYADNLKVKLPNEFDLLILFKFKYPPRVEPDSKRAGNVKINMTATLDKFQKHANTAFAYTALKKMCNSEGYLLTSKFQAWMQSILAKINLHGLGKLELNGRRYSIRCTTSGPAHTVHVVTDPVAFDVDLVPALLLDVNSWCAARPCPINARDRFWHAIPKPVYVKDVVDNASVSWQGSYANIERVLIENCNNLKNTLRMLKKLRDRQNYGTFKSYFIKTMYLHECSRQKKEFWNQSVETIIFYMIEQWIKYIECGKLPFYWDQRCNLLGKTSYSTMCDQLRKVHKKLCQFRLSNPEGIFKYFLTDEEISKLRADEFNLTDQYQSTDKIKQVPKDESVLERILNGFVKFFCR